MSTGTIQSNYPPLIASETQVGSFCRTVIDAIIPRELPKYLGIDYTAVSEKAWSIYRRVVGEGQLQDPINVLLRNNEKWKEIADRIHCPLNEKAPYSKQVLAFIKTLYKNGMEISNRPEDITTLLTSLQALDFSGLAQDEVLNQINQLQTWKQARDTLEVWGGVGRELLGISALKAFAAILSETEREESPPIEWPDIEKLKSSKAEIAKAAEFGDWFKSNKEKLEEITSLDLSFSNISNLPSEFQELTHLKQLNLIGNQLSSLPKWISTFQELEEVNLAFNQLAEFPTPIRSLTKLRELNITYNPLPLSTALWVNRLDISHYLSIMTSLSITYISVYQFAKAFAHSWISNSLPTEYSSALSYLPLIYSVNGVLIALQCKTTTEKIGVIAKTFFYFAAPAYFLRTDLLPSLDPRNPYFKTT